VDSKRREGVASAARAASLSQAECDRPKQKAALRHRRIAKFVHRFLRNFVEGRLRFADPLLWNIDDPLARRAARRMASTRDFDQYRLVIGSVGRVVHLNAADASGQVFRDEDKVPTVRSGLPLNPVIETAGRLMRPVGMTD
jgi:hypothetical protein